MPTEAVTALGEFIEQRMNELGIGIMELSRRAEVSDTKIRQLQRDGADAGVRDATLVKLAKGLGVNPESIFGLAERDYRGPPSPLKPNDDIRRRIRELRSLVSELEQLLDTAEGAPPADPEQR